MSNIPQRQKVQAVPCKCHVCGAGPYMPRIAVHESTTETVKLAEWICARCSSKYKVGEIERTPKPEKK